MKWRPELKTLGPLKIPGYVINEPPVELEEESAPELDVGMELGKETSSEDDFLEITL